MAADAFCVGACWTVSVCFYRACGGSYDPWFYSRMWPIVPVMLAVNLMFRLYHGRFFHPAAHFPPAEEMRRLVGSALLVHIGVIAFLALARQTTVGYSRFVIVLSGTLTAVFSQMARDAARSAMKRCRVGQIPVVIAGEAKGISRIAGMLKASPYLGLDPVGCFCDGGDAGAGLPALGGIRSIVRKSRQAGVRILVVCEDARLFKCRLREYSGWFTHIEYFPPNAAFPASGSRTVTMDGLGGVEFANRARMSDLRIEKEIVDKCLAAICFVLMLPVLLALALCVRLSGPGPVFFRHSRLGRNGAKIGILKFRTMYADADERLRRILASDPAAAAEWQARFKLRNDPRITPLGRVLRRTSLDELPQIFNVLAGTLALVGPRPIVEDEKRFYGESYADFASVKPGVTGLWQVSGRSDTDYSRRVALDVWYVRNWSPWLDVWILFRTVVALVTMRGAR